MVAGILGDELDNLEQVNIPKTVQVLQTREGKTTTRTKGAASIELSIKNNLDNIHFGYQKYSKKHKQPQQQKYLAKGES